jgi:hypothetical protein
VSLKYSKVYRIVDADDNLRSRLFEATNQDNSNPVIVVAQLYGELVPIPLTADELRYDNLLDEQKAFFPAETHSEYTISLLPKIARVAIGKYFESSGIAKIEGSVHHYEMTTHVSNNKQITDEYDLVMTED